MNALRSIEPAVATATTVGGVDLLVLITIVATVVLALSMVFLVVIALAPHLSSDWAERLRGSTVEVSHEGDSGDTEDTA